MSEQPLRLALAVCALLATAGIARAQIIGTPTTPPPIVGFGTLSVTTASVAVSTATLGPNAVAFPVSGLPDRYLEIKNAIGSANPLYVCPLGGTCTVTNGIPLALGEAKSWMIPTPNGSLTAPTVISAGSATAIISW